MLPTISYLQRRGQLEHYFDRTAADAWHRLTSDVPVSGIRATVRAGRDDMRRTLMSWLPNDLSGKRLLDAGCGTGTLAVEAARRGAHVVAIDLSPTLVKLARERNEREIGTCAAGHVEFHVGDFLDPALGTFDHVVAMDSLIHYTTRSSLLFTFAPRTALLTLMHTVGRAFPRGDRAPMIEPVAERELQQQLRAERELALWRPARTHRIARGFYISQALELARP
ncbi:MAG: magnesium protoporphyrin IX methyltransferase [Burkholderiaceae bacterium]|nr:magnesium protoporphyrin IX methyltransferase [Burkholderiaceae bacterium]